MSCWVAGAIGVDWVFTMLRAGSWVGFGAEARAGARGVGFLACTLSVASLVMGVGHVIFAAWWYALAFLGRFVGRRIRYMIGRAEEPEREIGDVIGWDALVWYV